MRNFEAFLRELAARGHEIRLAFDVRPERWQRERRLVRELVADTPNIRIAEPPARSDPALAEHAACVRHALDYLRYFGPEFGDAAKLRSRAARSAPPRLRWIAAQPWAPRAALERLLMRYEAGLPIDPGVAQFLDEQRPDVVLVTPLVGLGSDQADYAWAASRRGVPVCLLVASWDNLTNKGRIRAPLDLVAVWNEAQRREAIELHCVASERVVATGAHSYDHWFDWEPSSTRAEFCTRAGLPDDQPFILYVCSSKFIAQEERRFVLQWAESLRRAGGAVGDLAIVVRPHPQHTEQWSEMDAEPPERFVLFPRAGETPIDERSRRDYLDSIHYAIAVVGVNTSAQIEAAIVGRIVYAVAVDEFRATQRGTLHYRHLAAGDTPLVIEAKSLNEHVAQLERLCAGERTDDGERSRRFLERFVRPCGLEIPAAPILADAVERTARRPRSRYTSLAHGRPLRPLVAVLLGTKRRMRPLPR